MRSEAPARLLDVVAASAGLVLLSPLLLATALLIKADSPGPALFKAKRIGRNGAPFWLVKFRTMVVHAPEMGPGITTASDARVTRIGRVLRRMKVDELPQLINVLIGEMSLVGPRPEDPRYVQHYTAHQRRLLLWKPGITSPASIEFRDESLLLAGDEWEKLYVHEILPRKLALDLEYLQRRTLLSDLGVILRTVRVAIR